MSDSNISADILSEVTVVAESAVDFNKEFNTSQYYQELINQDYDENKAIMKVCDDFDSFCSRTTDEVYLIERYTELYNHNKVIKPMALSFITVLISVIVNLCVNMFTDTVNSQASDNTVWDLLGTFLSLLILTAALFISLKMIFKEFKKTYSPYDIFILPYERERIRKELVNRGYFR